MDGILRLIEILYSKLILEISENSNLHSCTARGIEAICRSETKAYKPKARPEDDRMRDVPK